VRKTAKAISNCKGYFGFQLQRRSEMRDPSRIPEVLATLRRIWLKSAASGSRVLTYDSTS
jgi:hypothetical protein